MTAAPLGRRTTTGTARPHAARLSSADAAVGIAVGAGVGAALGTVLGGGPALSTWVIVGIGAGVAVAAALDEAAQRAPVPHRPAGGRANRATVRSRARALRAHLS